MDKIRFYFAVFAAFCLLLSCLTGPVLAKGGPGGGGGGGNGGGGGGVVGLSLASQLADIWQAEATTNTFVKLTMNANGSFTLIDTTLTGSVTTQGSWTLGPAKNPQPFSNPQGFLTLTSKGQVLLSGDILLIQPDLFEMFPKINNISSFTPSIVFAKATP